MSEAPSFEEQFDHLVAEVSVRVSDYVVALHAIRNAEPSRKNDLWNAANDKAAEISVLRRRLGELFVEL